jgi:hypothetical protein
VIANVSEFVTDDAGDFVTAKLARSPSITRDEQAALRAAWERHADAPTQGGAVANHASLAPS